MCGSGVWAMGKAPLAKLVGLGMGLCVLALVGRGWARARQDAPPAAAGSSQGGSAGGSTARGRSIGVGEAEAQLRDAEQQPGPPARNLTRPLIQLSWAYWRAGRQREAAA